MFSKRSPLFGMLLAVALLRAAPVAAGVVGTGMPGSCTEAALDAALVGGLVTFDCGPDPVTITVTSTKAIGVNTTMDGGGLITISGGDAVGVFEVPPGVTFDARNLTIADGYSISLFGFDGGGISNAGTVWLTNCTLRDNFATEDGGGIVNNDQPFPRTLGTMTLTNCRLSGNSAESGGGILNGGTLTVRNSTFAGNSADQGAGGGIYNRAGGILTIANSTFSDDSATDSGGAIFNDSLFVTGRIGTLTVTNSTFSGNSATNNGGAIANGGTLTVTNSTFSGNSAMGSAGAIDNADTCGDSGNTPCPATLGNTIVAASAQGGNCAGAITDGGHNLDDGTSCGFSTANDSLSNTDPKLDPADLANNGAETQTIALEPDSPAINAGDPAICANLPVNGVDQRGFLRPGIGHTACSIGAYEADAVAAGPCTGDCNGNGVVTVNELILGVEMVLGQQPEVACPQFANSQEVVDVAQLIAGVNNALNGCSADPCLAVSGGAAATCVAGTQRQ